MKYGVKKECGRKESEKNREMKCRKNEVIKKEKKECLERFN